MHLEYRLSAAMLSEAIVDSERWYRQREEQLEAFDHRASATVARLVAEGRVRKGLAWYPTAPHYAAPAADDGLSGANHRSASTRRSGARDLAWELEGNAGPEEQRPAARLVGQT